MFKQQTYRFIVLLALSLAVPHLAWAGTDHESDDAFWADAAALLPGFDGQPQPPGPSNQDGSWGPILPWPHVPVSAASLPNGKILTYSGQERRHWPGTATKTQTGLWDPATGTFENQEYLDHEMFCAHLVMRTDGIVQTVGGRYTVRDSSIFDFRTNVWGRVDDMTDPRWYTSSVALPDKQVFTVSGNGGRNTAERYDPVSDNWTMLTGIDWQPVADAEGFESHWWAYLWVAPNGNIFHFGPTETMHWVNPHGTGSRTSVGLSVPGNHYPKHAGVAMYESGKILVAGGASTTSGGSSNQCYTVDLNTDPPTVALTNSMTHARRFSNATVLPTGEVLIVGGNTSGQKFSDNGTVLTPEIWNPQTQQWREVADMAVPRNYHSVGLLMPDGRVFSGGGGYASGNPDAAFTHEDVEIYTPPALFNSSGQLATRPVITSAPDNVAAGSIISVSATPNLSQFAAVRMMAVTHGWSTDQRRISFPFSETSPGEYQLVAHPNPNVMLPGYWMLFAIDDQGVYSESAIIHVKDTGNNPASGLLGEYFDSINLTNKKFERIDHEVNFDWGTRSPDPTELGTDTYSTRWTGWVVPNYTETHTFYTNSDDGVRLWVNGQQLIDNWTLHAPTEDSGSIALTAGEPVPVTLEYYENAGGSVLQLSWSSARTPKQIVPEANLRYQNPTGRAAISVDDVFEFFIDGELVGVGTEWNKAYLTNFQADASSTIAIRACNTGGPQHALGQFIINGELVVTDASWKVSNVEVPGWQSPNFDDSAWANATDYGGIPSSVTGMPVDSAARSIWSSNTSDDQVFLRFSVGSLRILHPGDQTTFSQESVSLDLQSINEVGSVTWSASGLPNSLSINPNTGLITGDLTDADIGSHTVTIDAVDSASETDQILIEWTVLGRKLAQEDFDAGAGPLNYRDDVFRGTNEPNYASGSHTASGGFNGSGGLQVLLGGIDGADITGMSGGWEFDLTLTEPQIVEVAFRYQLNQPAPYDSDEESEVLFSVNGTLIGQGGNDYLAQLIGGSPETTGWQSVGLDLGELSAGTHTLAFGGFNNKKTSADEITEILFDDLLITSQAPPNQPPTITPIADQSNTINEVVTLQVNASDPNNDDLAYSETGLPDGLSLDSSTGSITGQLTAANTFNVTITVDDGRGGTDSDTFQWLVAEELVLNPVVSAPEQSGSSLSWTITSTGGNNPRYKWNFGDGTPETDYSSNPTMSHTYAGPGVYAVTVTGTDDSGVETSITFTQNVHGALTPNPPSVSQSVVYTNGQLWNINPDNDTVSVFDTATDAKLAEIAVGASPRSLAVAPDGRLWVTNKRSASISILDGTTLTLDQTINLPRASQPFGIAFSPVGDAAYVVLEAMGRLLKLDPINAATTGAVDLGPNPRHLSVSSDGTRVYVSRFISPVVPGEGTATPDVTNGGGEVLAIDATSMAVAQTITLQHSDQPDSGGGGRGLPNYLGPAVISPDGIMAWVPSKQDNILRGMLRDGRELTHENTVRAISSHIDLTTETEIYSARVDHDDAAVPSTGLFGPNGLYLFVALEGSREIGVIDAYGSTEILRVDTDFAPQGLALSADGHTLYAHNFLSRNVTVYDITDLVEQGIPNMPQVATYNAVNNELLSPDVLVGKQLFYDARDNRLSREDYISCAACHNDGGQDGRVWDMTGFGEGLRNTITLRGRGGMAHGPLHWTGNFDEVQDFENQIRNLALGDGLIANANPHPPLGLPNSGRSADLDALAAYVASLDAVDDSPNRESDGTLTSEALAGVDVFRAQDCAQCHSGTPFTDSALDNFHDIGTLKPSSGERLGAPLTGIDTPTLRGIWADAPYLHDGSAATLADAVAAHNGVNLTTTELDQLVAYLEQIDESEVSAPGNGPPVLTSPGDRSDDEDVSVSLQIVTSDPDNDPLDFSASGLPTGLTIDQNTGLITGTPTTPNVYNVTVTADDGFGGNDSISFNWTINSVIVPEVDEVNFVNAPANVIRGETASVTVDYSSTVDAELWLWMQDSQNSWNTVAVANINVTPSVSTHVFDVSVDNDARIGEGYLWVLRLMPPGWTGAGDALDADYEAATVEAGGGGTATVDQLGSMNLPTTVLSPDTITLDVNYEATDTRELWVWLHDSQNNWFTIGTANTTVNAGIGTHSFTIPILANVRLGEGYLWAVRLLPVGWSTAADALDANYQSAMVELNSGGSATQDVVGDVIAPSTVEPTETVVVSVAYEATAVRDLAVWVQDSTDGWRTVGQGIVQVGPGFGTQVFNIGIVGDARIGDGYLWVVRLLPQGWTSAADELDAYYQEVEVVAPNTSLVNYAAFPAASATQSSNFNTSSQARVARDGNSDGAWFNGSVTHTELDTNAWWELDLGSVKTVDYTLLWNRTDCCGDRLTPYYVLVSDQPFTSTDLTTTLNQPGVDSYYHTATPLPTQRIDINRDIRYLRVQLAGSDYLSLAEVEVYGPNEGPVSGVGYTYYEGVWSQLPDFDSLNPVETGTLTNIDLAARNTDDFFAFRYRACLNIPTDGTYTLYTSSDEGSRLLINGSVVVDNDGAHTEQEASGSIALTAGMHPMEVQYFERDGAEALTVSWQGPGIAKQPIPNGSLTINETGGAPGFHYTGRQVLPDDNADGDLFDVSLEAALGYSPQDAWMQPFGLRIEQDGDDGLRVWYDRPARLSDVAYSLEGSIDQVNWSTINGPNVEMLNASWERVSYEEVQSALPLTVDRGFVRLKVVRHRYDHVSYTPVCGWIRTSLIPGYQTHGVSLNQLPVYGSRVAERLDQRLISQIGGLDYALGTLANKHCYVEFVDGPLEGHRIDVDKEASSDQVLAFNWQAPHNTLEAFSDDVDLMNAHFIIRSHWTLDEVYQKSLFQGDTDPSRADQVQFYNGSGYEGYFLLDAPGWHQWTRAGDIALADQGETIVPPGVGCFVRRPDGSAPADVLVIGHARISAFVQPLRQGYNLISNSVPIDLTPLQRGLDFGNGFLGATDPIRADQIQRWLGDSDILGSGYAGYFLLDGGEGSGFRYWTGTDDPHLTNENHQALFPADRAVFLRLSDEGHPEYRIPAP